MSSHSFEISVEGDLEALADIEDFALVESVEHEVTTVLSASFRDMEDLSATLRRLRAYGLEIIEIRRVAEFEGPGTVGSQAPEAPAGDPEGGG